MRDEYNLCGTESVYLLSRDRIGLGWVRLGYGWDGIRVGDGVGVGIIF